MKRNINRGSRGFRSFSEAVILILFKPLLITNNYSKYEIVIQNSKVMRKIVRVNVEKVNPLQTVQMAQMGLDGENFEGFIIK